jgi:hypothetical protein
MDDPLATLRRLYPRWTFERRIVERQSAPPYVLYEATRSGYPRQVSTSLLVLGILVENVEKAHRD